VVKEYVMNEDIVTAEYEVIQCWVLCGDPDKSNFSCYWRGCSLLGMRHAREIAECNEWILWCEE